MRNRLKALIWVTAFALGMAATNGWAEWDRETVGSGMGWASGVVVGQARNDGVSRVYTAGWSRLYEFTWNGSSWDPLDMGMTLGWGVALGVGRNDGLLRVYATFTVTGPQHGGVYEYTWSGSSWTRTTVATFPSSPSSSAGHGVALGPGRNDGVVRVYSCDCNNDRTFESTWTGSGWNTTQIFDWSSTDLIVTPGRGDGVYRLYCSHQGSALREYTWTGSTWVFVDLDTTSSWYYDVTVGEGRNDGVMRVYSGNSQVPRSLYELTWTGSAWEKARLGGMPNMPRCVALGSGRSDGINRVYSGTTGGSRYALEYSWNGAAWDSSWVDSAGGSGSYQDAVIGDGRSDGVQRLYMGSSDGYVYEFSYSYPGVEEKVINDQLTMNNDQFLCNCPNPFSHATVIRYCLPPRHGDEGTRRGGDSSTYERINLSVYDLTGRLVRTLVNGPKEAGTHSALWDGRNDRGKQVAPGIYFYRLQFGDATAAREMVVLR